MLSRAEAGLRPLSRLIRALSLSRFMPQERRWDFQGPILKQPEDGLENISKRTNLMEEHCGVGIDEREQY